MPADEHRPPSFASRCVHGPTVQGPTATPPVAPPIQQAAVYETADLARLQAAFDGAPGHFVYSRLANPTVAAFEAAVADLEGAEAACATASGMGAIAATLLAHLRPGDRVVATPGLYGATHRLLTEFLASFGVATETMGHRPLTGPAKIVYTETLSNPLLTVADLPRLAQAARRSGALLVVDNTFATPFHCRPLDHGADIVVHSATKFLGGHSDLVAGVAAGARGLLAPVAATMQLLGAPLGPTDAWLARRGLRTLALRMARQSDNATAVAAFLDGHPAVDRVHYPGLPGHPSHAAAATVLSRGFGAMVSFELASGGDDAAWDFFGALEMIRFAASLGDVATTVSHPATTSHRSMPREAGIGPELIRLSVGAEDPADIVSDLRVALETTAGHRL